MSGSPLHEIAAGSMDMSAHEVSYLAQAHWHHSLPLPRRCNGRSRPHAARGAGGPYIDDEGQQVTPQRVFGYDTPGCLSAGSLSNDFGTPGVAEHAMKLETAADAQHFRTRVINACIRAHAQGNAAATRAIEGGDHRRGRNRRRGWPRNCTARRARWSLSGWTASMPTRTSRVSVIEAAPRVLPALPERLSTRRSRSGEAGVKVHPRQSGRGAAGG